MCEYEPLLRLLLLQGREEISTPVAEIEEKNWKKDSPLEQRLREEGCRSTGVAGVGGRMDGLAH